jgi:RNA polymerase sigma-70 factor (ECF subfamily)
MTSKTTAREPAEKNTSNALVATFLECRTILAHVVGRITRPHDIEDIVQETFIRSYEAAEKRPIRHPKSFMLRTARNLALNHVGKADNKLTDSMEDWSGSDVYLDTVSMESQFDSNERFLLFCRAVRELPVQCRRVFILKKVYGLGQKEIAEFFGISQSTVEKHVAKGLLLCTEFMEEKGCPVGSGRDDATATTARRNK